MKKLLLSILLCSIAVSAAARIPDMPDFRDSQGYLYKLFRDDYSGNLLPGHDGEVIFWGVDTQMPGVKEMCEKVTKFTVPTKMTATNESGHTVSMKVVRVSSGAFSAFTNMKELIIPEGITYVDPFAFNHCTATRVSIPTTWTKYVYDFHGFQSKMEYISVAKDHPNRSDVNGVMYNADKTELITYPRQYKGKLVLPESLKIIGKSAFEEAQTLGAVVLPEGVDTLRKSAFYKSTVTDITLPSTLKAMGENALNYCKQLKTIRCKALTPPELDVDNSMESMELWGLDLENLLVYIPKGSIEAYRQAPWWRKITHYIEE